MDDDLIEYVTYEEFANDNYEEFVNENSIGVESQSKSSTWTRSETDKLIEAYDQYKDSFIHVKQRKYAWEMIATHLQALNVMKLAKDCSIKWNNLLRTYKAAKDNKSKTGRGPIRFEYFSEMDNILGTKASNSEDGAGVSIGASTEGLVSVPSADNTRPPIAGRQQNPNQRKRKMNAKDEYYKAKIERIKEKSTNEKEALKLEKEKIELLKKLVDKI